MERPGRTPENERQPGAPGSRILAELPAPIEAGEKLLTVLDGELMKMLERTQGLGRAIDQDTARVIAYALIARAPEGALTGQLQQLLDTGTGNHDSLKAEYLPLRALPDTTFDQRLLIDALGTRLAGSTTPPLQTRAARYAHITTIEVAPLDGEPVDVLFKSPVEIGPLGATALTMRFLRLHREHGDAFLAYLRSPGVAATWQDIDERFRAAYIGSPDALAAVQEAPDSTGPCSGTPSRSEDTPMSSTPDTTFTAIRRKEEPRMERPPTSPPEQRTRRSRTGETPRFVNSCHEEHATSLIRRGLEDAERQGGGISASTARVIAATLHRGHGSHMEHFAATGDLNPAGVLAELDHIRKLELEHVPRVSALWDFLERIEGTDPDTPEDEHVEPAPMVFIQADDPQLGPRPGGRWLHADVPAADLDEQIVDIHAEHAPYSERTVITAAVGFHGLDIPEDATPKDIARYADGVRLHGEAYALFAGHAGYPVGGGAFSIRYQGSYDTITEFMAEHASFSPLLGNALSRAGADEPGLREETVDEYEQELRRKFLILDGRDGVHVFSRTFGLPEREVDL